MQNTLRQQIINCPDLPSLPAAALALLKQTENEQVDIPDLAAIISRDPALCAKLLRVVNSSLYSLGHTVTNIEQAAALMGAQSLRTLVLGFSLVNVFQKQKAGGFNHLQYWRRSMYAATAARIIADHVLANQRENCFIAALLMDIGALVLDKLLGTRYGEAWERVSSHTDLPVVEAHMFGTDHAEVGEVLVKHWMLPPTLAVPIGAHHNPFSVEDPVLQQVAQIIWLSGRCADIFVAASRAAEGIVEVRKAFMQQYRMTELQCDGMLCTIGRKSAELAHLFDVRLNTPVNFEQVAEKAAARLTELSLAEKKGAFSMNRRRTQRQVRNGQMTIIPCRRGILEAAQQVTMHDVSATGMGFTREMPMEKGQQFVIQLPDKQSGAVKTLLYTVVRCTMRGGLACIGAELTSVLRPEAVFKTPTLKNAA